MTRVTCVTRVTRVTWVTFVSWVARDCFTSVTRVTLVTRVARVTKVTGVTWVTTVTKVTGVTWVTTVTTVTRVTKVTGVTWVTKVTGVTRMTTVTRVTRVTKVTGVTGVTWKAIINELEFEDKKSTDPTEIAENFYTLFAEISPKLSENIEDTDTCFDEFVNQSILGNFSFQQISPSLISSHLHKLCMRKATGLDTVSVRLLRECFDLISVFFPMNGRALGSLLSTRNVAIEAIPQITGRSRSFLWWLKFSSGLFMISYIVI